MTWLWHSSIEPTRNWASTTDSCCSQRLAMGTSQLHRLGRKWLVGGIAALVIVAVALLAPLLVPPPPPLVEIGVFLPGPNDSSWIDFSEGLRLACAERNLRVEAIPGARPDVNDHEVRLASRPVRFHWLPDRGPRAIQRKVQELCQQEHPPLAVIGANNSSLTWALASALEQAGASDPKPVLLMTNSTAQGLIDVYPRSLRFGHANQYQARTVVAKLQEVLKDTPGEPRPTRAIVVQVLDDPFSVDLAFQFERELELAGVAFVSPDRVGTPAAKLDMLAADVPKRAWTIPTATGSYDSPSDGERQLASQICQHILRDRDARWVVVLPVGTNPFRRLTYALFLALKDSLDPRASAEAMERTVFLLGDSIEYYAFAPGYANQLFAEETPGSVIFFAHVDPLDPTVVSTPNRHIPARGLAREVCRGLLDVLDRLGPNARSADVFEALAVYTPKGSSEPYFHDRERRSGGGAIVANPKGESFEIVLPDHWRPRSS